MTQSIRKVRLLMKQNRDASYLDKADHWTILGWSYIYLLDYDTAERYFRQAILDGEQSRRIISKRPMPKPSFEKLVSEATNRRSIDEYAAYGFARVYAEKGDYKQALFWIEKYGSAFGSGCGNCQEAKAQRIRLLKTIWQTALLPSDRAEQKRQSFIAGKYKPQLGRLNLRSESYYVQEAIREARLMQAGRLLREGKLEQARGLLNQILRGGAEEEETFVLAAAHLAKLEPQPIW